MKLGQHFLKSKNIVNQIIKAAELKKNDIVLEVGPGKGILTKELLEKSKKVIAIEKDRNLFNFLKEKFPAQGWSALGWKYSKNLELIHADILKPHPKPYTLDSKPYKIVANIPYYITSRFLRNFLSADNQPTLMVLMLQKEVAKRIVAKPPHMNMLALSVQVYGKPKIIEKVPKKYFSPSPKVDSAIIKIDNISKDFFNPRQEQKIKEKEFFDLLRKGFSHKRKMLKNNLKISEETLAKCDLEKNARAQELNLKNWISLYRSLENKNLE